MPAKGFLFTGGCFGSRWPIVPYVTEHFFSCFVVVGKPNILILNISEFAHSLSAVPKFDIECELCS
jgi:hypothetical protein